MPVTRSRQLASGGASLTGEEAPPASSSDGSVAYRGPNAQPRSEEWGQEPEEGSQEQDGQEDDDMPLPRSISVYHRRDDTTASCGITAAVMVPLLGSWWKLSTSWREHLMPQLQQMLENAKSFWQNHPIVLDDDLAAFKSSRNVWHQSILGMRDYNRDQFDTMLQSGQVTAVGIVTASVVVTLVAIYLLLFLPDASIFLSFETRQRPGVRIMFNSVVYMRRCLCVLAVWQLLELYRALQVSIDLATALEANVKKLHRLADELLLNVTLDPDEFELKAYRHEQRRWGIKAFNCTLDHQFWIELRNKSAVVGIVLYLVFSSVWQRIQDERKWQMKRQRSIAEKFLPALPDFDLLKANVQRIQALEEKEAHLKQELVQTQSKVSQISTSIPHKTLNVDSDIGRGSYGIVWKGKWRDLDVAMKAVEIPNNSSDLQRVMLEKDIFLSLSHPSLVQCYGTSEQPAEPGQGRPARLWIVLELCEYGSLDSVLRSMGDSVKPRRRLLWMRQVASGMGFLHERGVSHRDLKAANVLIDRHRHARMCDYGASKLMGPHDSHKSRSAQHGPASGHIGTWEYMPPEALRGERSNPRALDVFSFGVLLNEIASGQRPWEEVPESRGKKFAIQNLVANDGKRPQLARNIHADFQKLIEDCWATRPANRPSFDGPRGIVSSLGAITDYTLSSPEMHETPGSQHRPPASAQSLSFGRIPQQNCSGQVK